MRSGSLFSRRGSPLLSKYLVKSSGIRRKDEIMDTVADINKAKILLKWEPTYTLQDGLTEIINN